MSDNNHDHEHDHDYDHDHDHHHNGISSFPRSPSEFDGDPRVSYSRVDEKYLLETEEGAEWEWDAQLRRWIAVLDPELADEQARIYRVPGVDEDDTAAGANTSTAQRRKKRKQQDGDDSTQKSKKPRVNTAVYVTSIPLSVDSEEINHVFSKCGVIAEEIDSGKPRIKLYEDDQGNFKGDALVVYFRPESVKLAVQMLDDTDFRLGLEGPMGKMKVQAADFSYKSQQEAPAKSSKRDQKKIIKKTQKLNSKLADWDDDDPSALPDATSKWDKVVILKHMFTLEELEEDPAAMLEIKEDIREECSKLGEVTNVVLFDREPQGVASVRFATPEAAGACVKKMHGRWFDERQLQAHIATGREKFKKSNDRDVDDEEDAHGNEGDRLEQFGSWLEDNS